MIKHTPIPWFIQKNPMRFNAGTAIAVRSSNTGVWEEIVALVNPDLDCSAQNARLIAAAPDMYGAATEVRDAVREAGVDFSEYCSRHPRLAAALISLETARVKVESKQ